MFDVPAAARLSVSLFAVFCFLVAIAFFAAYYGGAGAHKAPRQQRPQRTPRRRRSRATARTALLTGELPPADSSPTQPLTPRDTIEMWNP